MPPDPGIGITHLAASDIWLVHLHGEHDLASEPDLVDVLTGIGPKRRIVIDLTETTFIDSTIIGTLVNRARAAERRNGSLIVAVKPATPPARVIDLGQLGEIVPVFTSLHEALLSLEASENGSAGPAEVTSQTGKP